MKYWEFPIGARFHALVKLPDSCPSWAARQVVEEALNALEAGSISNPIDRRMVEHLAAEIAAAMIDCPPWGGAKLSAPSAEAGTPQPGQEPNARAGVSSTPARAPEERP